MSFEGKHEGPDGSIAQARKQLQSTSKLNASAMASNRINLASALYGAATSEYAESKVAVKTFDVKCLYWLWLTFWRGKEALLLVDTAWRDKQWVQNTASFNDKDIALSVWCGFGLIRLGRKKKAKKLIDQIFKIDMSTWEMSEIPSHTKAFLLYHAMMLRKKEYLTFTNITLLESLATEAELEDEPEQAGRIWSKIHVFWKKMDEKHNRKAALAYKKAVELAEKHSPDQLKKIDAR